jgi:hypothetical protein
MLEDGFKVPRWHSSEHWRPNGDISYDLVMKDDMEFAEGSYRIGGCDWHVFVFSKLSIDEPSWKVCIWESGVDGIVVNVPAGLTLNPQRIETVLSDILGVGAWERVSGPDSMQLR